MTQDSHTDAEDILAELENTSNESSTEEPEIIDEKKTIEEPENKNIEKLHNVVQERETRNTIPIGKKPIMTYVNSTLTQLSSLSMVTITARGKSITTAVDVSQFILKRMNSVGYKISDVRISSELLESNDGKKRNVSSIEIDIMRT